MKLEFLDHFRLKRQRESYTSILKNIEDGVVFNGSTLWILFFAILIASLGLNTNSTAVVIGAMLISPLMGPIIGLGVGVATNAPSLIQKSTTNYLFSAFVGLAASTIYFSISPIRDAQAEIIARTQPTVYDVLIALFGGFAGMIAISSKYKGNVIPGAAIATALMPPLCTAGYGLATWQLNYFFGAIYLYIINSVFISAATFFTAYYLKFPVKKYKDPTEIPWKQRLVWLVIIITLLPSIYLGYDLVQQNDFTVRSNAFIDKEANFPNDYLLKRDIDAKNEKISLTFGGQEISKEAIDGLRSKLPYYGLDSCFLEVKQGFSIIMENPENDQINQLVLALKDSDEKRAALSTELDSLNNQQAISQQVFNELKAQCPEINAAVIQPVSMNVDSSNQAIPVYLMLLNTKKSIKSTEKTRLESWLKVRMKNPDLQIIFKTS